MSSPTQAVARTTDDAVTVAGAALPDIDIADSHGRVRPARWVASAVLGLIAVALVLFLVLNSRFEWDVVGHYLFYPTVLKGLGMSVVLAVVAMGLGTVLGTVLALAQVSTFTPGRIAARAYIAVFRSIPPLVQLIFWFNLGYLVPTVGPWRTTDLITSLTAAIIGLTLHESAYIAEIIRSGLGSIPASQRDAAKAVGMTSSQSFFKIVVPQAMRVILPPFGNEFISTIKGTSLVSVIAMSDLLFSVQVISDRTYQVVPMLVVACIWYLVVITILTYGQRVLERRYGRGFDDAPVRRARVARVGGTK